MRVRIFAVLVTLAAALDVMLAAALDAAPAAAQSFDQLKCVRVSDRTRFKATVDVAALDPAFGLERGCKLLGARLLCTPATSTVTSANVPQLPVTGEPLATDKICYAVRCPRARSANRMATDQFGGHALTVQRTSLVCLPAGTVVCTPSGPEVCDGVDNDCDGLVDELGDLSCGVGPCARTVPRCVDGNTQTCTPGTPEPETCNGVDDDCDGTADDGFGSVTCGVGDCEVTVQACLGGEPQSCTPGEAGTEICDGRDNDCDGTADDGLDGVTTCGLGACAAEVEACTDGRTQVCVPESPATEACNTGIDENCNGLVDEQGCVCQTGRADCDLNASNGCETTLATDLQHCGECDLACAGAEECIAGICTAP
jgi:hypothetical protein